MSGISLTASFFYCHSKGQSYCVMLNLLVFALFYVMLESIVAKRKRSAARGLRDEEDPLAGVSNLFQHLYYETLKRVQGDRIEDRGK